MNDNFINLEVSSKSVNYKIIRGGVKIKIIPTHVKDGLAKPAGQKNSSEREARS